MRLEADSAGDCGSGETPDQVAHAADQHDEGAPIPVLLRERLAPSREPGIVDAGGIKLWDRIPVGALRGAGNAEADELVEFATELRKDALAWLNANHPEVW